MTGKAWCGAARIAAGLRFNTSSRMKPRWLLFALTMLTDDVIFVQYTVPTIVMSRQCDQTPRVYPPPSPHTPSCISHSPRRPHIGGEVQVYI